MVKKLNSLDKLKELLASDERIIKFNHLDNLIRENSILMSIIEKLHILELKMKKAMQSNMDNEYILYKKEYENLTKKFKEDVLFNEYLNAKDDVLAIFDLITSIIEKEIDKKINE